MVSNKTVSVEKASVSVERSKSFLQDEVTNVKDTANATKMNTVRKEDDFMCEKRLAMGEYCASLRIIDQRFTRFWSESKLIPLQVTCHLPKLHYLRGSI